jgi:hypothetical protein
VPAAGPDHGLRPGRVPLRRGEAPLREADPDQRPRLPRPRALHPVRPLHPLRRRGGRRPAHPLHRPGQPDPGQHVPRRALRLVLLGQHRADLPGRRAHRQAPTASRPARGTSRRSSPPARRARSAAASRCSRQRNEVLRYQGVDVDPVNWGWLCDKGRFGFEAIHAEDRLGEPLVRDGDELVRPPRGPTPRRAADAIRPPRRPGPAGRRARRRPAHQRGRLRLGQAGQGRHRHRQRRRPARRRPARRGRARPAPRHHRRGLRPGRHRAAPRPRPQGGAAGPVPAAAPRRGRGRRDGRRARCPTPRALRASPPTRCVHARAPGRGRRRLLADGARPRAGGVDPPRLAAAGAALRDAGARHRGPRPGQPGRVGPTLVDAAAAILPPIPTGAVPVRRCGAATCTAPSTWASPPACCPGASPSTTAATGSPTTGHRARRAGPRHRPASSRPPPTASSTCWCCSAPTLLADFPDHDLARRALAGARTVIAVDRFLTDSVAGRRRAARRRLRRGRRHHHQPRGPHQPRRQRSPPRHRPRRLDDRRRARPPPRRRPRPRVGRDIWAEIEPASRRPPGSPARRRRHRRRRRRRSTRAARPPRRAPPRTPWASRPAKRRQRARRRRRRRGRRRRGRRRRPRPTRSARPPRPRPPRPRPPTSTPRPTTDDGADGDDAEPDDRRRRRVPSPATARFRPPALAESRPLDAYSLRLLTTRTLYDLGTDVQASPLARRLAPGAAVRLHPHDFDRLGVAAGADVTVSPRAGGRSRAGPPDGRRARGARCVVPAARPGHAAELVDATRRRHRRPGGGVSALMLAARPPLRRTASASPRCSSSSAQGAGHLRLLLVAVMFMIWFERKVIADMQNRIGPNRAGPFGILQTLADGIKLFFKEDLIPDRADRLVFIWRRTCRWSRRSSPSPSSPSAATSPTTTTASSPLRPRDLPAARRPAHRHPVRSWPCRRSASTA